jgi:hypothetical protein
MRGVRDGIEVEWDIAGVPADGGLPASAAIVSHEARPVLGATGITGEVIEEAYALSSDAAA